MILVGIFQSFCRKAFPPPFAFFPWSLIDGVVNTLVFFFPFFSFLLTSNMYLFVPDFKPGGLFV